MVLWTLDRYGNMFIYDTDPVGKITHINQVNHSSMNAGHAVIGAGMIVCNQGMVVDITNTSGHYKPNREQFAYSLELLMADGLNLNWATIRCIRHPVPARKDGVLADLPRPGALRDHQGHVRALHRGAGAGALTRRRA
jgi:hypothetical protein